MGTRIDVLRDAKHPYTQGLLRSMPSLGRRGEALAEIPGVVPSPNEFPPGCRFSTRCSEVFEVCRGQVPSVTALGGFHSVRCHHVERELQP